MLDSMRIPLIVALLWSLPAAGWMPSLSAQENQTAEEENAPPTEETTTEPKATPGLLARFEAMVDKRAGEAVNIVASVFFYEFVGKRDVPVTIEQPPFDVSGLSPLVQQAVAAMTDEQRTTAEQHGWPAELLRPHLNDAESAQLEQLLQGAVDGLKPFVAEIGSVIPPREANYALTLASDDLKGVGPVAQAVLTRALQESLCGSRLRSMTITTEDLSQGGTRSLTGSQKGIPIVVAWLVVGAVFFTLRMGFINVRGFMHAIRVTAGQYDDPTTEGEVSHFQALTAALSATVGLGNIAGVAVAVGLGGPGATFWMIVAGLLGMTSKFAECTLGQMYRQVRPDGRIMGGAMYYLSNGLKDIGLGPLGKVLAIIFAGLCVCASFGGGNAFQVNQAINAVQQAFPGLDEGGIGARFAIGVVMATLVAIVILGGIRRIASTAEKVVPLMCAVYVAACLYILIRNAAAVPGAFSLIFESAFTPQAGYGGVMGVLVLGFKRAAFSNEAGVGSAAIAHSAAKTEYPVREGIVALLEPFIDTVVVCTMTALVIVITGAYDISNPEYLGFIQGDNGAALTVKAMGSQISWFPYVLAVAVMLFAYSTMISWSYYGERCWSYLFGDRSSMVYRVIFVVFVVLGSVMSATNVLVLSDLMILGMAFPNVLGVALLSGRVRRALDDYWQKLKSGEMKRNGQ